MPKHYDVHLIRIVHVVVEDDTPEPEWAAVGQAAQDFWSHIKDPGVFTLLESDFWATHKQDVYPVDPCDCQEETHP